MSRPLLAVPEKPAEKRPASPPRDWTFDDWAAI